MLIASKKHSYHYCPLRYSKVMTTHPNRYTSQFTREWESIQQQNYEQQATGDSSMKTIWMIMTSAFWLRQQNYKYDKRLSA